MVKKSASLRLARLTPDAVSKVMLACSLSGPLAGHAAENMVSPSQSLN
ncbi:MAG: hypothetical protein ACWA44_08860 [Thiotrichales bacterium]